MAHRGVVGVGAGVIVAGLAASALAWAQSAPLGPESRRVCRSFPDPEIRGAEGEAAAGAEVDTRDTSGPVGRWVVDREDRGWRVDTVERQIVVKATGALQGWTHVCVVPVPR